MDLVEGRKNWKTELGLLRDLTQYTKDGHGMKQEAEYLSGEQRVLWINI